MSIRSLSDLAVKRDGAAKGARLASTDGGRDHERVQDSLISSIPTEILTLYTAITGGTLALAIKSQPQAYLPFRWIALVFAVLLTPFSVYVSYQRKRTRAEGLGRAATTERRRWNAPVLEMGAATLAAAAWFLAMPGSPMLAVMSETSGSIAATAITVGAVALLSVVFAPILRTGATKATSRPPGRQPPAQRAVAPVADPVGPPGASRHPSG